MRSTSRAPVDNSPSMVLPAPGLATTVSALRRRRWRIFWRDSSAPPTPASLPATLSALKFGGEIRKQRLDAFYKQGSRGQFTFDGTAGPWASDNSFSTPQKALADFLAGLIGPAHASIATGDPQRVY